MTADQHSQMEYYAAMQQQLSTRTEALINEQLPKWNKKLPKENRFDLD